MADTDYKNKVKFEFMHFSCIYEFRSYIYHKIYFDDLFQCPV